MADDDRWLVEIFDELDTLNSFLNHVRLRPDQLVDVRFHPLSPTLQRILVTCRLSAEQAQARLQWRAVERTLHPEAVAAATGGAH